MKGPLVTRHGPSAIPQADYYELAPHVNVFSWCPTPDGSGKPEQVHMHIGKPGGPIMLTRFKSPLTLDAVINALIEHREHVWGKR